MGQWEKTQKQKRTKWNKSHIRRTYTRCMCGNSEEKTKEAGGQGCFTEREGQARPEDEQGALWLERKHRRMRQQGAGEGAHPRVSAGKGTAGLRGMAGRAVGTESKGED